MKIEINKIKTFFGKTPRVLGENAFLTAICFIILSLIFGGFVFYRYIILTQKAEPDIIEKSFKFQENDYQNILKIWQEREEKFNTADSEQRSNPFQGPPPSPTPTPTPTKTK